MSERGTGAGSDVDVEVDVVVVGGGLGGVAAALAATDLGATVLLSEAEDLLGGQLTTQLVACPDEHPLVETVGRTRSWARLRELVRARHGGEPNPGGGWVSRVCATPADFLAGIDELLAPALRSGRLDVRTGHRATALLGDPQGEPQGDPQDEAEVGDGVGGVVLVDAAGRRTVVRARVTLDATETGDLLPLVGDWVVGSEGATAFEEPHATPEPDAAAEQSVTWCAALRLEHLAPWSVDPPPRPSTAAALAHGATGPFSLTLEGWDGSPHVYRFFADGPDGRPPFWSYRRMVRGDGPRVPGSDARVGDVICLNWAGNDHAGSGLVADPVRTREQARALTLAFVDWLRTSCPRDDGGTGYHGLALAPDVALSPDGLALAPYVRESRRLRRPDPLTLHDLAPVVGSERARPHPDAVALVWYHADLHPRVGHPGSVYSPTAPAQVALHCLVHPSRPDLLAAGKGLAATQVAAAATRVHPAEWAIGEAAGVCAALAVARGTSPAALAADPAGVVLVQRALLRRGAPVAWTTDVLDDDPDVELLQLLLVHGGVGGDRATTLDLRPDEPVDPDDHRLLPGAATTLGVPVEVVRRVLADLGEGTTPRAVASALHPHLPDLPDLLEPHDAYLEASR
jgi:hypothetical protein